MRKIAIVALILFSGGVFGGCVNFQKVGSNLADGAIKAAVNFGSQFADKEYKKVMETIAAEGFQPSDLDKDLDGELSPMELWNFNLLWQAKKGNEAMNTYVTTGDHKAAGEKFISGQTAVLGGGGGLTLLYFLINLVRNGTRKKGKHLPKNGDSPT